MPSRGSDLTSDLDLDLDLPPLDGSDEGEEGALLEGEGQAVGESEESLLDDATAEDEPIEFEAEGAESGWLDDAEGDEGLEVGAFDLDDAPLGVSAAGDEEGAIDEPWMELGVPGEASVLDAGEEGPVDGDEELSARDLPELDADEEGDVVVTLGPEDGALAAAEELLWDDRAWEPIAVPALDEAEPDDADVHLLGHDPTNPRENAWRALESTGRVTAAAILPGGDVVVALSERAGVMIVRIASEGQARIIAEVSAADDHDDVHVSSLRWDGSLACLVVVASSGVLAFRPS